MMRPAGISASCFRCCERSRPHSLRSGSGISRPNLPSQVISFDEPGTLIGAPFLSTTGLPHDGQTHCRATTRFLFAVLIIDLDEEPARRAVPELARWPAHAHLGDRRAIGASPTLTTVRLPPSRPRPSRTRPLVPEAATGRQVLRLVAAEDIPLRSLRLPSSGRLGPCMRSYSRVMSEIRCLQPLPATSNSVTLTPGIVSSSSILPLLDQSGRGRGRSPGSCRCSRPCGPTAGRAGGWSAFPSASCRVPHSATMHAAAGLVEHLDGRRDHVGLRLERLAGHLGEVGQRVLPWHVQAAGAARSPSSRGSARTRAK